MNVIDGTTSNDPEVKEQKYGLEERQKIKERVQAAQKNWKIYQKKFGPLLTEDKESDATSYYDPNVFRYNPEMKFAWMIFPFFVFGNLMIFDNI